MSHLLSPKPVSYLQNTSFNGYQNRPLASYSDSPPPVIGSSVSQPPLPVFGIGMHTSGPRLGSLEEEKIVALVADLMDAQTRESALLELSKKREQFDDLALILWHSFGKSFLTSKII